MPPSENASETVTRLRTSESRRAEGGRGHRVAAAGNVAVLTALVAAAALAEVLFEGGPTGRPSLPVGVAVDGSRPAARAVLVVIDGLRADTASDPEVMPFLCELARQGGRGVARVECLVPSSVAAIETLATGEVPPPVSFLSDFGAGPAGQGGIFAAVRAAGGSSFVAGPTLWTDRFGRWIDAAEPDPTFGGRDDRLLAAATEALGSRRDALVVVHLGQPDASAHRFGAASTEYRAAAGWCDRAARRIAVAAGPEAAVVVTSDHGNRDAGGHAGLEPDVVRTPLVVRGPRLPAGEFGEVTQSAVPALLLGSLGIEGTALAGTNGRDARPYRFLPLIAVAAAVAGGLSVLSGLRGPNDGRRPAFVLNAAVWLLLGFLAAGWYVAATALGLAAFVAAAVLGGARVASTAAVLGGVGVALGVTRLADGYVTLSRETSADRTVVGGALLCGAVVLWRIIRFRTGRPVDGSGADGNEWRVVAAAGFASYLGLAGVGLSLVYAAGVILGSAAGELLRSSLPADGPFSGSATRRPAWGGAVLVAAFFLSSRAAGETVSLSTVDVRAAFGVVDLPRGAFVAAVTVAATQAAPAVGLLLGAAPFLARLDSRSFGAFASGVAALSVGQAAVAAVALARAGGAGVAASLGLGLLLRGLAESMYFFLGTAAVAALASRAMVSRSSAPGARLDGGIGGTKSASSG